MVVSSTLAALQLNPANLHSGLCHCLKISLFIQHSITEKAAGSLFNMLHFHFNPSYQQYNTKLTTVVVMGMYLVTWCSWWAYKLDWRLQYLQKVINMCDYTPNSGSIYLSWRRSVRLPEADLVFMFSDMTDLLSCCFMCDSTEAAVGGLPAANLVPQTFIASVVFVCFCFLWPCLSKLWLWLSERL